jgi:symplekin
VPFLPQINEALAQQSFRMDRAAAEERARRTAAASASASSSSTPVPTFPPSDDRKRPAPVLPADAPPEKRARTATPPPADAARAWWAAFDYGALPASLVTDLVVGALAALDGPALAALVAAHRAGRGPPLPSGLAVPAGVPAPGVAVAEPAPAPAVKEELTDEPAALPAGEIDTEEMEYSPDALNEALADGADAEDAPAADVDDAKPGLREVRLPPPRALGEDERHALLARAFARLWADAGPAPAEDGGAELWMLLVVRSVTRAQALRPPAPPPKAEDGAEDELAVGEWVEAYERQDRMRQVLADYVLADFGARVRLASAWMNEEWYNDRVRGERDPEFVRAAVRGRVRGS